MESFVKIATTVILVFAPVAAITQDIDLARLKPLVVEAVEAIRGAALKSELSAEEYEDILDVMCNALAAISEDDDFAQLLNAYERGQYDEKLKLEVREVFLNVRSFFDFMLVERDLLLDAGLSEEAVAEFFGQVMRVRLEAAGFKFDANTLLADLHRLADQACSAKEHFSDNIEYKERMCNLAWMVPAAIGMLAVVVDIPLAFAPGLQIPSAVSLSAGGASISVAGLVASQC